MASGFLVDRTNLREARGERERELARAAGDVEQPARTGRVGAPAQVVEHRLGIGHAVLVVEVRRPLEQVATELGLGARIGQVDRIDTPAVPGAP